ncbi:MAG: glycosyltransferase, partial [Calditrichaeota bacterium]
MRIAVTLSGYGYIHRGAEIMVENVVKHLRKNHIVDVFSIGCDRECIEIKSFRRDSPLAKIVPERIQRYMEHGLFAAKAAYKIARDSGYDIVWCHDGEAGMPFMKALQLLRHTPVIATAHGGGKSDLLISLFHPNAVVVFKPEAQQSIQKRFKNLSVTQIPHGIDLEAIRNVRPNYSIGEKLDRPIIVSTGALVKVKRIHLLINAVKELKQGTLVLIGDGPLKRQLQELGTNLLRNRFLMLGESYHSEVLKWLSIADVYSLASSYENFSIGLLEALGANCPVVTHYDLNRKRIVGDAGILVNCEDTKNYAAALLEAYHTNWGNRPQKQVSNLDWAIIAQKYE